MNYFKVNLKIIISDILVIIILISISIFITKKIPDSSRWIPTFIFSSIFLTDGTMLTYWSKKSSNKKQEGSVSYIAFKIRYFVDWIIGISFLMYAIFLIIYV